MYKELLTIKEGSLTKIKKEVTHICNEWELPPSYLEFTTELGFGRLLGLFLTYIPMGEQSPYCDALEHQNTYWKGIFKQYLQTPLSILKKQETQELVANAEPFLYSENGEIVFWDVRNPKNGEFPIYLANFPVGIYFAGNNFQEFITNLTSKETFKSILKFYEDPLPATFEPLTLNI